jgi:hypothetical protein
MPLEKTVSVYASGSHDAIPALKRSYAAYGR